MTDADVVTPAAAPLAEAVPATLLPIAVFGLDDAGRAHGSRFDAEEAELATKAAGLMAMQVLPLDSPDALALAAKLPQGRIFASGKAFVPFVGKPVYEALAALGGVMPPAPADAAGGGEAAALTPAKAKGRKGKRAQVEPLPSDINLPAEWAAIGLHSLVLVTPGGECAGWFEAVAIADKGDDLFELRWFDWPAEPSFLRRRDQLALVPAAAAELYRA